MVRARKIERFFSQADERGGGLHGQPGVIVPVEETIRGFEEILAGEHDELPEQAFYMVGTIDEAVAKAEQLAAEG